MYHVLQRLSMGVIASFYEYAYFYGKSYCGSVENCFASSKYKKITYLLTLPAILLPQEALGRNLRVWLLFRANCESPSPMDAWGDLSID